MGFLKKVKEELLRQKKEIEKSLSEVAKKSFRGEDGYEAKFPQYGQAEDENVDEVSTYVDRVSLEASLEKKFDEIKIALQKIRQGKYGKCESCGKKISRERLGAMPTSRYCLDCQNKVK